MPNRQALSRNPVLTGITLLAVGWVLFTAINVAVSMEPSTAHYGYIGFNATSGWIGLAVMGILLAFLLIIYAELPADDPQPERFPPEDRR